MRRVGTVRRATDYVVGGIALLLASIAVRPADAFAEVAPVTEDSLSAGLEAALSIAEDVDVVVETLEKSGITKRVVALKPIGNVKG